MPDPLGWQLFQLPWGGLSVAWEHHKGLICWEVEDYSTKGSQDLSAAFLCSVSEELTHHPNPALHLQEILTQCTSSNWRLQKILNAQAEEDPDSRLICEEYLTSVTLPSLLAMISLGGNAYSPQAILNSHTPKATLEYLAQWGTMVEKRAIMENARVPREALEILSKSTHSELAHRAKEKMQNPTRLKKILPFLK